MSAYTITLQMIRSRATAQSFQRGEQLYREEAISRTVQRGDQIEGLCEAASQPSPYRVSARLSKTGIEATNCTCSYEYGGDCKHRVALLLTYLRQPDAFQQLGAVEDSLASRSKEDLIALIHQMISRYPDLQAIIDRPTPQAAAQTPVDTTSIRKELRRDLRRDNSYEDTEAVETIESIVETAQTFAVKGDWVSVSSIYRAIIEEVLRDPEIFYQDENGDLGVAVDDVLTDLGECMEHLTDEGERQAVLKLWLDFYLTDIEVGDYGADIPDLLLRYARQPDFAEIRRRIQSARNIAAAKPYSQYMVRAYTDFLTQLDLLDNVDPEVILKRLRDEGQYDLLINKLLDLGRPAEAVEVVEQHITQPYTRLIHLGRLAAHGQQSEAIRLAEATLKAQYDDQMARWLVEQLRILGDKARELHWQRVRMREQPSRTVYRALKETVENPAQWEAIHQEVVNELHLSERYDVLTQVYLNDGEWAKAWDSFTFRPPKNPSENWHYEEVERELVE